MACSFATRDAAARSSRYAICVDAVSRRDPFDSLMSTQAFTNGWPRLRTALVKVEQSACLCEPPGVVVNTLLNTPATGRRLVHPLAGTATGLDLEW